MATGKRRVILKPTGKQMIEEVKLDAAPIDVNIDPDNIVLKEVMESRLTRSSGLGVDIHPWKVFSQLNRDGTRTFVACEEIGTNRQPVATAPGSDFGWR